jgi:hypothetical protein
LSKRFRFFRKTSTTRAQAPVDGEEKVMRAIADGEFHDELAELARVLGSDTDYLSSDERQAKDTFDEYEAGIRAAVEEIAPQLIDHTPDEAYEIVRSQMPDDSGAIAMGVRFRVWEIQLGTLEADVFELHARDVEENEVLMVDYTRMMVAIDVERERRGLELPELPSWEDVYPEYRRLERVIASFDFTDEDLIQYRRAQAQQAMIFARDDRHSTADGTSDRDAS